MDHPHHRRRSKRSVFDGISFTLKSPSYEWNKILGGEECGASFGLTIRNELNLDISPLSGFLKVDCFDEAYARAHLGMVGMNIDMFIARFCFKGHAKYNLNLLQVQLNKPSSQLHFIYRLKKTDIIVLIRIGFVFVHPWAFFRTRVPLRELFVRSRDNAWLQTRVIPRKKGILKYKVVMMTFWRIYHPCKFSCPLDP